MNIHIYITIYTRYIKTKVHARKRVGYVERYLCSELFLFALRHTCRRLRPHYTYISSGLNEYKEAEIQTSKMGSWMEALIVPSQNRASNRFTRQHAYAWTHTHNLAKTTNQNISKTHKQLNLGIFVFVEALARFSILFLEHWCVCNC